MSVLIDYKSVCCKKARSVYIRSIVVMIQAVGVMVSCLAARQGNESSLY